MSKLNIAVLKWVFSMKFVPIQIYLVLRDAKSKLYCEKHNVLASRSR